jgi:hypothetical protein
MPDAQCSSAFAAQFLTVRALDFKNPRNQFHKFRAALHCGAAKAVMRQASAFTAV